MSDNYCCRKCFRTFHKFKDSLRTECGACGGELVIINTEPEPCKCGSLMLIFHEGNTVYLRCANSCGIRTSPYKHDIEAIMVWNVEKRW